MPGSMPPTSQLEWLSSMTAMIVLFWSRATRDLLKSFGWGIAALHRLDAATMVPFPRRPPHSISRSRLNWSNRRRKIGSRQRSPGYGRGLNDHFARAAQNPRCRDELAREGAASAGILKKV